MARAKMTDRVRSCSDSSTDCVETSEARAPGQVAAKWRALKAA